MTHIFDWVDEPTDDPVVAKVKEWFNKFLVPAVDKDYDWLDSQLVTCDYKGKSYRVTGASRLGDVWLISNFSVDTGYDLRVDVALCTNWGIKQHG